MYPTPSSWGDVVSSFELVFDPRELEEAGWIRRDDTTGLLEAFVALADGTPERIRRFALKWGPLWRCVNHQGCFWTPYTTPRLPFGSSYCSWIRAEPLSEFRRRAVQVKAAFDAAACLLAGKRVPAECWRVLSPSWGPVAERRGVPEQRRFLAAVVNAYLTLPGRTSLHMTWGPSNPKASLTIDFGLGFFGLVWLQIAQLITGARGLFVCDGCGRPYIRAGRRPRAGERNYCPQCGKAAAKRDWARLHYVPRKASGR